MNHRAKEGKYVSSRPTKFITINAFAPHITNAHHSLSLTPRRENANNQQGISL
jgi:hypothetical protein